MPKLKADGQLPPGRGHGLGLHAPAGVFKVTLHEIAPGIVSGAIMAFTMSLDDFVISYFVSGLDFVTLPWKSIPTQKSPSIENLRPVHPCYSC